ncbi:OmpA family protein [Pontibacter harenae]|uniref:OmpA family protein n=1 Tax=Pontibacter harenae TaxID=2894083 RepID=UPI001E58F0C8|nr:OmpA family protein [Pontibacter harenae]MCC9167465.1 OmpA family protein [Pontibacter harenae]
MYKKLLFVFLFMVISVVAAVAQNRSLSTTSKRAENFYNKAVDYEKARDFDRALSLLRDAVEKDPNFTEAYLKAAHLNQMMGKKEAVLQLLEKALADAPFSAARMNNYYTLAELYFERGNYEQASKFYSFFLQAEPRKMAQAERAQQQIKTVAYAIEAMRSPIEFKSEILPETVNRFFQQYFPSITADGKQLIFTARKGADRSQDEDIYISGQVNGIWQAPVSISSNINTPANEGAASISGDGKTLVFTSCNRPDGNGDCDLYISYRTGNDWSKPQNIGSSVNSRYWDSQPALSADGRTLYFTSNRGGGLGKEDIWITHQNDDGTWQKPSNAGAPINSAGKDMAPFLHASGSTLYFVSDGHVGLGGLDVFMAVKGEDQKWSEPQNMGYPLNTFNHETALFITPDSKTGYYSRQGETGADRIQLFSLVVPAQWRSREESTYAQGRVFDADTKKPIGAVVQLYNVKSDSLEQQVRADQQSGEYTVVLTKGKQYALYVTAPNYLMNSLSFDYTSSNALTPVALDVYLKPIKAGASVVLSNLFFDTNEYKLKPESKTELNKLISFLQLNKDVKLEIEGHTDDVGQEQANQLLSERRAKSVVEYLAQNGINSQRLRSKGYGESKPVAPNTTEENRSQNRRIEMRVL